MGVDTLKHLRQAVFLDRDGVLSAAIVRNGRPLAPRTLSELTILPDALNACSLLRQAGFLLIVVTNQPDVSRGTLTTDNVDRMNRILRESLPIDDVRVCLHDDADGCICRKPKPGLVLQAAHEFGVDISRSFLVGDRWRDIDCGIASGCTTVFIDRGYTETLHSEPHARVSSVFEAANWILQHQRQ